VYVIVKVKYAKSIVFMMCVFGFQSASYGFLGTALNTESEKAFLKSLKTHSGVTDEQAKALLLKAARLQERLHKWSAAGAAITAPFLGYFLVVCLLYGKEMIKLKRRCGVWTNFDIRNFGLLHVFALGIAGWTFGTSLGASIRAKKRAARYKKMAHRAAQLKAYQCHTEKYGSMEHFDPIKKAYTLTWNTIAKGRKKVIKKGLNAQLIGTSIGAGVLLLSTVALNNYFGGFFVACHDGHKQVAVDRELSRTKRASVVVALSAAFTLFSAYGLKGVVRKQAMKKLMAELKTEIGHKLLHGSVPAIAKDPEAAALALIGEWERKEAAA
jgi:hypothetical protein